jgi:hypothetical protein
LKPKRSHDFGPEIRGIPVSFTADTPGGNLQTEATQILFPSFRQINTVHNLSSRQEPHAARKAPLFPVDQGELSTTIMRHFAGIAKRKVNPR